MGWSFRIARIWGIEVRVHVTFLLLLAFFAFGAYQHGGGGAALKTTAFILLLFLCVLLHEFGHALAAARYGIKTPDITLLPIGGVARLQRMPDRPVQELVVAIAGPLVNVAIAAGLFLGGLGRSLGGLDQLADVRTPASDLLGSLLRINVALVLFNLIPAFPMDGGRVLRALLAMRMNYAKATRVAATVGQVLAFGFAFWGLSVGNVMLVLIAVFVYFGAGQEAAAAQMRDLARHVSVREAMVTEFVTLPAGATLGDAVEALLRTSQHEFPVLADGAGGDVLGVLTRDDMIPALREGGPQVPVTAVMRRNVPSVGVDSPFEQAFQMMNEAQVPAVLVRDRAGRLVGVVTPENVGEMMMVQAALGDGGGACRRWAAPVPAAASEPGALGPSDVPLPPRETVGR
jgi:stage IV sporulation protein FB